MRFNILIIIYHIEPIIRKGQLYYWTVDISGFNVRLTIHWMIKTILYKCHVNTHGGNFDSKI